jgi:hypothetical protein
MEDGSGKAKGGRYVSNIQKLIDNGYYIIPIKKGEKRPAVSKWQDLRITDASEIKSFTDKGCGIGILTGVGEHPVCGVDIDSMDEGLVDDFVDWFENEVYVTISREGKPPKRLLMCQTENPYAKIVSRKFEDSEGNTHQLELLGTGQQFVAYGVHPATGGKYQWGDSGTPTDTPLKELPPVHEIALKGLVNYFEHLALDRGYTPVTSAKTASTKPSPTGDEALDVLMSYEPGVGMSNGDAEALLVALDCEDYDLWIRVGMALHHEFSGSDDGLELWDGWSSQGLTYKGRGELTDRWRSFNAVGRTPITMRSVLHEVEVVKKEEVIAVKRDTAGKMYATVRACSDQFTLLDHIAGELGSMANSDAGLVTEAEKLIKQRYKELTDGAVAIGAVRKAMRSGLGASKLPVKADGVLSWANPWVYVAGDNQFFNTDTGVVFDPAGFRGKFGSEIMGEESEGMDVSRWALDNRLIPKADRAIYMPGAGRLFKMDGVDCVNTYCQSDVWDPEEERALAKNLGHCTEGYPEGDSAEIFKQHIQLLIGGGTWTREAQLFTNFLRYIIERPGRKLTWATLLQGSYGDGKSEPITRLMGALLGAHNTNVIQAQTIEGSIFNDWAEGHCFAIIEEIKLHGHNRYDILNRMNAIISNDIVEIHPKGSRTYSTKNTGNYYITTNFTDAVPIVSQDRRYFVLFSKFPEEYTNNTAYFDALFKALGDPEGVKAVGRWLLSVSYHEDFKPNGHAPHTLDKDSIVELSRDICVDMIEESLEDSDNLYFCEDYIIYGPFHDYISHIDGQVTNRMLNKYVQDLGYKFVQRHLINGKRERIWVRGKTATYDDFAKKYELRKLIY